MVSITEEKKPDRIPFERLKAIQTLLAERYPAVFGDFRKPKPLAIGTREKLIAVIDELGVTRREIIVAVKLWTGRLAYQRALAAGGIRYNLDGSENGEIPESHQGIAKTRIGEIEAKLAERRANQQKPPARSESQPSNAEQRSESQSSDAKQRSEVNKASHADPDANNDSSEGSGGNDKSHTDQRKSHENGDKKPRERFSQNRNHKSENSGKPRGNGRHKSRNNQSQRPASERPRTPPPPPANSLAAQLGGNPSSLAELQSLLKEASAAKKGS